jgi:hypothetical protein
MIWFGRFPEPPAWLRCRSLPRPYSRNPILPRLTGRVHGEAFGAGGGFPHDPPPSVLSAQPRAVLSNFPPAALRFLNGGGEDIVPSA